MSALFSTLYSGGEVILPANCAGFRVEIFWRDIAACGATWYTAVPTMQQLLLKGLDSYAAAGRPQVRFIRSCSASLPPSVLQSLEKEFGAPVLEAYAMTEAAHQISSNPLPSRGPHKAGSVGKGTNVEIAILPEEGEAALPNGEVGEVSVRGRNVTKAQTFATARFERHNHVTPFLLRATTTGPTPTLSPSRHPASSARATSAISTRRATSSSPAARRSRSTVAAKRLRPSPSTMCCFAAPECRASSPSARHTRSSVSRWSPSRSSTPAQRSALHS